MTVDARDPNASPAPCRTVGGSAARSARRRTSAWRAVFILGEQRRRGGPRQPLRRTWSGTTEPCGTPPDRRGRGSTCRIDVGSFPRRHEASSGRRGSSRPDALPRERDLEWGAPVRRGAEVSPVLAGRRRSAR
jgi:hypothetical protein